MHRRTFLRTVGTGTVGSTLGVYSVAAEQNVPSKAKYNLPTREVNAENIPTKEKTDTSFQPLGAVSVRGARDAAVHHDDEIVYVAGQDGFAVVDISDPAEPTVIAECREIATDEDETLGHIWDLWPSGDRLAVVGPAVYRPSSPSGVALFDISNPSEPEQVAFHPTEHYIHNSFFADDIVYLTGSGLDEWPLVMVDVSDDEPTEVGRWSLLEYDDAWADVVPSLRLLHDVYVQDDIAYLLYWDAGTWLVDVSDPTTPEVRSAVMDYSPDDLQGITPEQSQLVDQTVPGNHHYAQIDDSGDVLVVGREAWTVEDTDGLVSEPGTLLGAPGGLTLWDVSETRQPRYLADIEPPESFNATRDGWFTTAHNCDIVGDRLYASWYFGGITVHDISDPSEPERIAWWRNPEENSFWTAQAADGVFVASSVDLRDFSSSLNETQEALYVFPDRAGEQPDPPDLTSRPEDYFDPNPTTDQPRGERMPLAPAEPFVLSTVDGNHEVRPVSDMPPAALSDDSEPAAGENQSNESGGSIDGIGPGFGVGSALGALSLGYLWRRRRTENE